MKGGNVRWVQWGLVQAEYDIEIDGKFGPASDRPLQTCKSFLEGLKVCRQNKKVPQTRYFRDSR